VLSGQRRPEIARADGVAMAAECITSLLPTAERWGVTLVLENHYKDGYWQYPEFAQRADVFLELLDAIPASPFFGVNYDPSNALIAGDDPLALLEAVKGRVVSMHASDRYLEGGTSTTCGGRTPAATPGTRPCCGTASSGAASTTTTRSSAPCGASASGAGSASRTATTRRRGWSTCACRRSSCAPRWPSTACPDPTRKQPHG
jgi:hypothetical protein